ncbi:opacity protein-like surface antigen [Mycoplana sp. BE70]|uniref:outer membrane protein n=1 Tax=Mycoplana sp. BE70 TaxID=2817775 RepID=UPI00285B185C|nr:porin family protein [Mycoplana sp. BE70]MDR6758898.1 opacity protein-like surface antigen [Mycoplana sp. BE70]
MIVRKTILGAALIAGLSATGAQAGGELYPVVQAPEVDMGTIAVAQGWYIRGDLGYSASISGGNPSYTYVDPFSGSTSGESFDDSRFSKPFSYGFGMGYQFNNFMRADLTTDFFNSSFDAESGINQPCPGENAGTGCDFSHDSGFDAISVMANGYVDLGTYAGFTPYLGAGIGATNIQWDDLTTRATCVDGAGTCSSTAQGKMTNPGEESWRFTYALMAGASYDLTNRVKLDVGYRYSDIDGGKMFGYNSLEKSLGASGTKASDDGFQRHEIRAGIRVTTW